jgi:EAL domain-containing protein (putative c-di-GMP-specific phosphodiesterase class I)
MLFEENDEDRMVQRMLAVSETFSNRVRKKFFNMNLIIASGVCKIENPNDDIMVIIDNANIAKKQAKEKNKSSCDFFGEKLREKMRIEFEVTNTMEKALAHNEFKVYFQPKVELATGKLVGAEALVRWIKPDGSIMPPDKFIPLFEKNGFVVNLDFFVYEEVCKMFRVWLDSGINVVPISVNVSRVHLYDASFVEEFTGMIDSYNVPHELIELELTESIFLDNTEVALKTMKDFREYGFKVSIDDFGAGYSSLNLLKNMTSDVLKLDKEFFGRGELQKEEEIILTSIVNMAKQLNMKVLSEGVETLAQSKFLKEIACDMAQGYLFAKPMPKESFELIMANDMQFNI